MNKILLMTAAVALVSPAALGAQTSDFQQWTTASVTAKLSPKLRVQDEFVARFSDNKNGLYEIENSLLLGYQLSDKVTAWAGYLHNPNYSGGDFTVMERRAREQVTFDNVAAVGKAKLSLRARFEQRWRENADGTAWRFRPYAKVALPLGGKKAPTLNLTDELFVNLNNTAFQTVDGIERNRAAISLSLPVGKKFKAEAGYLNQHKFVPNGPDTDDHALTAGLSLSL